MMTGAQKMKTTILEMEMVGLQCLESSTMMEVTENETQVKTEMMMEATEAEIELETQVETEMMME
eukprot:3300242-Ditylum_brightwellii.AAC.1